MNQSAGRASAGTASAGTVLIDAVFGVVVFAAVVGVMVAGWNRWGRRNADRAIVDTVRSELAVHLAAVELERRSGSWTAVVVEALVRPGITVRFESGTHVDWVIVTTDVRGRGLVVRRPYVRGDVDR